MKENKIKNTYHFNGKLKLKDDEYEYILIDGDKTKNITEIIGQAYQQVKKPIVSVIITINGRVAFSESGFLAHKKDNLGIYSYFILGENLDEFLFNHTDKYMEIEIETLSMGDKK